MESLIDGGAGVDDGRGIGARAGGERDAHLVADAVGSGGDAGGLVGELRVGGGHGSPVLRRVGEAVGGAGAERRVVGGVAVGLGPSRGKRCWGGVGAGEVGDGLGQRVGRFGGIARIYCVAISGIGG